jgi:hypothetical protein
MKEKITNHINALTAMVLMLRGMSKLQAEFSRNFLMSLLLEEDRKNNDNE